MQKIKQDTVYIKLPKPFEERSTDYVKATSGPGFHKTVESNDGIVTGLQGMLGNNVEVIW